ncbi:EI24-domain-containing protein [Trametopsis cervina]|nr:EI24-domain-containing protein [Trametopsis cervina]
MSRSPLPARPSHHHGSARSAYPVFLSFPETALLQLKAAGKGLVDAFRWDRVVRLIASDAQVRSNIFKSLLLNLVSLTSIYFFDLLLFPLTHEHPHWLRRNVGWVYQVLWLFPIMGASLYLNSSWCSQLANRTFTLQHGARAEPPATYSGILNSIATSAYRVIMICTAVVISFALQYVPLVGPSVGFVFMCWIDSFYCFEFTWIARGYSLSRRLRLLEERWAYFLTFGLPSTALCMWGSTLANAAVFALVYPAYIIMAMHARPIPVDPYNPAGIEDTIRHPSPFIPIRIPVFSVVVWLNDRVIGVISFVSLLGGPRPAPPTLGHRRALSDSVESVEEGEGPTAEPRKPAPQAGTRIRVSRGTRTGGRKKLD